MNNRILTTAILFCLTVGSLYAQSIQLILAPNLSPYISDWQNRPGSITLIINNTFSTDLTVKIKTEMFDGSGALLANTQASKMPVLTAPPGISQYNAEDVFPFSAISYNGAKADAVAQTGRIPDDNYKFCVYLTNPQTGLEIGQSSSQCKVFNIVAYQAPTLIAPRDKGIIPQIAINGIVFRWTPVIPIPNVIVTYRLQVWEVLEGQNDVTALRNNQPIVEKDIRGMLQMPWPVEFALPEVYKNYVWTITPLDDEERKLVDGYGFAQPFGFSIGPSLRVGGEEHGTVAVGETITAGENGEFNVVVTEVTIEADGTLTGKGKVFVNWLYVSVAVEFKKITINYAKRLTAGGITAVQDPSKPSSFSSPLAWVQAFASTPTGAGIIDGAINWTNHAITNTVDWVNNHNMGLSDINYKGNITAPAVPSTGLKMPFGLQFPIKKLDQKLYITEMLFNPNESKINFLAQGQFFKSGIEHTLGFTGKYFIIHQNNIEFANGRLELAEDVSFPNVTQDPKMEFTFLKEGTATGCYIEWSDNGIEDIGLGVDIAFSRDWLLPIPSTSATSKVKASISGNGTSMKDILISGKLPNCEIVGTNGIQILADGIGLDISDTRNFPSIVFPENYPDIHGVEWQGLYVQTFGLTLPESWKTGASQTPPFIQAINLVIDDFGISTKIRGQNIFDLQSGSVADLSASLELVEISIVKGSLVSGKAEGKLVLPISDATDQNTLKYTASFSQAAGAGKFQIVIVPYQDIEASILKGKMTLNATSNITASYTAGTIAASMSLHGVFKWDNPDLVPNQGAGAGGTRPGGIKGVKMELSFENVGLEYTNKPNDQDNKLTFNSGNWSFASPQKKLSNFPVTIKKIRYKSLATQQGSGAKEMLRGAIMIDIVANLTEDIGGSTTVGVAFSVERNSSTKKFKAVFRGVSIEKISVHADLSAVKIDGSLEMRDNLPVFGDGFLADISVTFTAVSFQCNATVEFGNTTYGGENMPAIQRYRYFRVEADVILPVGIPFLTGVGFYGFGGGAFYNMTSKQVLNKTGDGYKFSFTPEKSKLGFMVKAIIGTLPKFDSFNADVELLAEFSTSNGLTQIGFNGNFWVAADLASREKAYVKGGVAMDYNFPDKIFDLQAKVMVNIYPEMQVPIIVTPIAVGLHLNIDGRTNKWYFISGTPEHPNTVNIFGISLYSYLMFGNAIPVPDGFTKTFIDGYSRAIGSKPGFSSGRGGVGPNTETGKGFATGVGIQFPPENVSKHIYKGPCRNWSIEGNLLAGAELNLALMEQKGCPGINGHRASGHLGIYAYINAGIRGTCHVDYCPFWPFKCGDEYEPLFSIKVGAWLLGKFPNPHYAAGEVSATINLFGGDINCYYKKEFKYGTDCNGTEEVITNQAQEDEADSLRNKLIQYIAPSSQYSFPVKSPISVKYALIPNKLFDVPENQGDGTVKNRTFMLETVATLEIKQANGTWVQTNLVSKVNNMGEFQYYRNGAASMIKETYAYYKPVADDNVKKANALIQAGSQMSSSSTAAAWSDIYKARYELALANLELAKINEKFAKDNLEFTLPANIQTAQANITSAGLKLQAANVTKLNLDGGDQVKAGEGKGTGGFDNFINSLPYLLQNAQGNSQVALANWQLAKVNAAAGGPGNTPATPNGPVTQVNGSAAISPSSGGVVVGPNGQINAAQIPAVPIGPPEPNYPNPAPPLENNLSANTDYRFTVKATLMELNTSWSPAVTRTGKPVAETKVFQFSTGSQGLAISNN